MHWKNSLKIVITACVAVVALSLVGWGWYASAVALRNDRITKVHRIDACRSASDVTTCLKLNGV